MGPLAGIKIIEALLAPAPAAALAALLDLPAEEIRELPPLWHWIYFTPTARQSELGPDGHPAGGLLPRRMFAGADLTFHRSLRLGLMAERTMEQLAVTEKSGRSGRLIFVKNKYLFFQEGALCIEEIQDIVYRDAGGPARVGAHANIARVGAHANIARVGAHANIPAPAPDTWHRTIIPDPVMLFRFSALTFNAHRIHYDRPYATEVELYPGLVVHGPLTAMLLAELARSHAGQPIRRFRFRGLGPLFEGAPIRLTGLLQGESISLQAIGPDGAVAVEATATL